MESPKNNFEELLEGIESYLKTTYELSKLKLLEATANVISALVARLIVVLMFSLFILVLNIGIALWLGDILGKSYYGFFVVAGLYFIAGLLFNIFRNSWIKKPLSDSIIKQTLK
jgi:hypothetical protein